MNNKTEWNGHPLRVDMYERQSSDLGTVVDIYFNGDLVTVFSGSSVWMRKAGINAYDLCLYLDPGQMMEIIYA